MDRDLPKEEPEQSIFNQVGEFDFTSRNGNPARYLLLFLTQQGKSKVKIFTISLIFKMKIIRFLKVKN